MRYNQPRTAAIVQWLERGSVEADVVGSNPTSRPNYAFASLLSAPYDRVPRPPKYIAAAAAQVAPAPPDLFVGTSGWAYPTWKPGFYPAEVPTRAFLHHYAAILTAVEVNYTFRALPTRPQLEMWLASTPPGFRFSFKAPQRITHFARLQQCTDELDRLLVALAPAREADKLGPILFQLPPNFAANPARLADFLEIPALCAHPAPQIAFEFRHPSWFTPEIYSLLRSANAALCIADTDDLSTPEVATADFSCYRLRRDGGYTRAELDGFAQRFTALAQHAPTYVFFRHQDEPTGALNAAALLARAACNGNGAA